MAKEVEERIQLIDVESIIVKADRYRKEHGDIESLAISIRKGVNLSPSSSPKVVSSSLENAD